ncbi:MAG: IS4 family transposase [Cyanobacteria bacterium J06555_13]
MSQSKSTCIRAMAKNRAEQVAYYRFLENPSVTSPILLESLRAHCHQQVSERHVLAISDTSEINLQAHAGRLKAEGQGVVGNNTDIGFFIHPTLVVDAASGLPLGLSHVQLWNRAFERPSKEDRDYQSLAIEDKESYKWIAAAQGSTECFTRSGVAQVTYIGDSEADIYEPWFQIPRAGEHLLVRACQDRRLVESSQKLYDTLAAQPVAGTYWVDIPADPRAQRTARQAQMALRYTPVKLRRPDSLSDDYPPFAQLNAIEVIELVPPEGEAAIHWRLLTTHAVDSAQQAEQIIQWYRWRWHIELLFATLKQRGFEIESSQLESIAAIQKLCIMALSVAVMILQLTLGRENIGETADIVFDASRQRFVEQLVPKIEGHTEKQKNPYPIRSLAWVAWLIARLGGWSGYRSQRPRYIV